MKHTPTHWKVSASGGLIVPDNGNPIATICRGFGRDEEEFPNWPANARRIVACVNACEGLKTEELEAMKNGLWRDVFIDSLDKDVIIDEIKAQNARLLEALKAVVRVADRKTAEFDLAHAAIAEAEKITAL